MNKSYMKESFEARLMIEPDSFQVEAWRYELIPTNHQQCGVAEWAKRLLEEQDRNLLLDRFKLNPSKCWQVIFKGHIFGTFDYWGEYDEWYEVDEFQAVEVDASYFDVGELSLDGGEEQ
jgi:hypothetical protein